MTGLLTRLRHRVRGLFPSRREIVGPPLTFRTRVINLVRRFGARRVAEVGVWKGELSRLLLTDTELMHLLLVDPLEAARNCFLSTSRGPHPAIMRPGVYHCDMGEPPPTQADLNRVHDELTSELERDHPGRTTFLRLPSLEAARQVPDESLDFVFIDAIHLYEDARADIAAWLPKLRSGGVLAGHDYTPQFRGVMRAVDEAIPTRALHVDQATAVWYAHHHDLP
jgi:hypothetical protein